MEQHLGEIVKDYRMHADIPEKIFCAKVGRSLSWLWKFESTGRCYDRTRTIIFDRYPAILAKVLEVA